MKFSKLRSGQTIIEVLIAFAVTVLIGVGLVTAGLSTQKAAVGAKNEAEATKLAQEYIERVRSMRDIKGWNAFLTNSGGSVLADNGLYRIDTSQGAQDVSLWTLSSIGSGNPPCNLGSASYMYGEVVTIGNVTYCRRMLLSGYSGSSDIAITLRVDVGWQEGGNVRSSSAGTTISKWCSSEITGGSASPCPN